MLRQAQHDMSLVLEKEFSAFAQGTYVLERDEASQKFVRCF
jgi:hypothetical protein